MARKCMAEREIKRRAVVERYAAIRAELKKKGDLDAIAALPRDSSPSRLRNRCSITGRGNGYMRKFGVSRQVFREMAHAGLIPGVTKSSW